jgi:hypothetical protein
MLLRDRRHVPGEEDDLILCDHCGRDHCEAGNDINKQKIVFIVNPSRSRLSGFRNFDGSPAAFIPAMRPCTAVKAESAGALTCAMKTGNDVAGKIHDLALAVYKGSEK